MEVEVLGAEDADKPAKVKKANAELKSAESANDKAQKAQAAAQERRDDAQCELCFARRTRDDAKKDYEKMRGAEETLPAKITQAADDLGTAQQQVEDAKFSVAQSMLAELAAFAESRDNPTRLVALGDPAAVQPNLRVDLMAYKDARTIFIRGPRNDVQAVKDIIAEFDRPAPHARLILQTLQLTSKSGYRSAQQMNEASGVIEDALADTRAQMAMAQSLLQAALNEEVNRLALFPGQTESYAFTPDSDYARRIVFYNPEVVRRLGVIDPTTVTILNPEDKFRVSFLKANLPDPASTTTFGEALMVLSLARSKIRNHVLDDFERRLRGTYGLNSLPPIKRSNSKAGRFPFPRTGAWFSQLRAALDAPANVSDPNTTLVSPVDLTTYDSLTPTQDELVKALQRVAIARIAILIRHDVKQLEDIAKNQKFLGSDAPAAIDEDWPGSKLLYGLPDDGQQKFREDVLRRAMATHRSEAKTVIQELLVVADWLRNEHGLPIVEPEILELDNLLSLLTKSPGLFASPQTAGMIQRLQEELTQLAAPDITNARIAAADEMLKRIIIAAEDDMDRNFVRPMLEELQQEVLSKGVSVGVMQRTQVLATNRLIARSDPHGTAQLALGRSTDAIAGLQAILDLGAIPTAGASGALATAGAVGKGVLGVAKKQAPDQRPEAYGIETGGEFRLIPIIDPSGQALRFRFDYVLNTPVHEPSGTLNLQLPVLTQSTNTEVQLSNLEIRSIAAFDATVQMALTPSHTGGIPLLNDLPILRSVPVIGWFHKTRGRSAHQQKTVIIGQTTIYPTIGDITNLLTPLGPRRLTDREHQQSPLERANAAEARAKAALRVARESASEAMRSEQPAELALQKSVEAALAAEDAELAARDAETAWHDAETEAKKFNKADNGAAVAPTDSKTVTTEERDWAVQAEAALTREADRRKEDERNARLALAAAQKAAQLAQKLADDAQKAVAPIEKAAPPKVPTPPKALAPTKAPTPTQAPVPPKAQAGAGK